MIVWCFLRPCWSPVFKFFLVFLGCMAPFSVWFPEDLELVSHLLAKSMPLPLTVCTVFIIFLRQDLGR